MAVPSKSTRVLRSSAVSFGPSAMLTIKVGPAANCQSFLIHESFLTAHSEYFRRAMNGRWAELETRIINLSDDDPEIFALYLNHIYKNEFPVMAISKEELCALPLSEFTGYIDEEYTTLFKLYVLAEKLQDDFAKDEVITAIFQLLYLGSSDRFWVRPSEEVVEMVYDATPKGSFARRFCVDSWSNIEPRYIQQLEEKLPRDFLFDLAMVFRGEMPKVTRNVAGRKGVTAYLEATRSSQKQKTLAKQDSTPIKLP
ncbi:hypothetical protein M3J09_000873 [Ascochyta lentis]